MRGRYDAGWLLKDRCAGAGAGAGAGGDARAGDPVHARDCAEHRDRPHNEQDKVSTKSGKQAQHTPRARAMLHSM
jgi:hypothetical protein